MNCLKMKKEEEEKRMKKHASGYWYQFLLPRKLTIKPTRIWRWLNFIGDFQIQKKKILLAKFIINY